MRLGWDKILRDAANFQLVPEKDLIQWKFGNNGHFSVKSFYKTLTISDADPYHMKIWKRKIPAKIKIFLWLIMNNAILTKDNMITRRWLEAPLAISVIGMKLFLIFFFNAVLQKLFGPHCPLCFGANDVPRSIGQCCTWCENWHRLVNSSIPWVLQLSAGQFGKHATLCVLKANL